MQANTRQDTTHTRRVVFLKLRKTGGTSLSTSVLFPYCVKYGLKFMVPMNWFAAHPRLVKGNEFHMMFRHFPDYPQPWAKQWLNQTIGDHKLITILRDPVSRAISGYNEVVQHSGNASFDAYLARHHEQNHQSNWLGFNGRNDNLLEKHFSMIGITERFDESMLLFRRALNLNLEDMLYIRQRTSVSKTMSSADLSQERIDTIKEVDWLDVKLYERAKQLVDKYVEGIPDIADELNEYQKALSDFSHPLWGKRGPFPIGYSTEDSWSEFTGQNGKVNQLRELPP